MAKKINNIHDKFVRESFSDPRRAAASLQTILPKALSDQLDFDSLQVLQESYMDSQLSEYFSDLVFEVALNNASHKKLDVALLFEHKSAPDKNVLIQLGYYLFAHYHKCIVDKKPLKPIIPIIYYQGKKEWKVTQLSSLFGKYSEDITNYLPIIHHVFVALHQVPDQTLLAMKSTMMAVAMVAQKWRHDPVKLAEDIIRVFSVFHDELEDRNFLKQTFVYVLSASDIHPKEIKKILETIPEPIKEDIMTTYTRIAEENQQIGEQIGIQKGEQIGIQKGEQIGIQKGEQIGIQKEKVEIVLKAFDNGVDIPLISNITDLSEEQIHNILKEHGKVV
ncbi:MAG: Rpn family recombination-promoting nuclease/putative transposase [Lewinellaceae bacterium]|nr:Rpn family recombination-promoting nuclease/putative transposase [Lewinellaceae bacterium]